MQQVSKITTKDYEVDFEWIMQSLWDFQWMPEDYIESQVLDFKEATVSS